MGHENGGWMNSDQRDSVRERTAIPLVTAPVPREPTPEENALELLRRSVMTGSDAAHELGGIRATLLVNFGDTPRNTYGFKIEDKGSTTQLLVTVLKHLTGFIDPVPEREEAT